MKSKFRFTPHIFLYQDLIGVELYARHKYNPLWGSTFRYIGKVIDETKNTLYLSKNTTIKQYIKNHYYFRVKLPQDNAKVLWMEFDGNKIVGYPYQRIKQIKTLRRKYH